jgi:hypothetical protein
MSSKLAFDPAEKKYGAVSLDAPGKEERLDEPDSPIRIRAQGAGVPAFTTTIRSAKAAQLTEPVEMATISTRPADFVVRWSDGGNESVAVLLNIGDSVIECSFPASAGMGIIPAAQMSEAIDGSNVGGCRGNACTSLVFAALRTAHVAAGDYDVSVTHSLVSIRYLVVDTL